MTETTKDPFADIDPRLFDRTHPGKFAPKLSMEERCAVYALFKKGMAKRRLAAIFGVDRRTVSHICNEQSPHYKDVRTRFKATGSLNEFATTYITADVRQRIADTLEEQEKALRQSYTEHDAGRIAPTTPKKAARGKAGQQMARDMEGNEAIVEIKWIEGVPGRDNGWYTRKLGEDDDMWGGPHVTSSEALSWWREEGYLGE